MFVRIGTLIVVVVGSLDDPLGAAEMDTVRLPISIFALAESGVFCTGQKGTMSYFSLFGSAAYSAALGTSIFAVFANPINFPPRDGVLEPRNADGRVVPRH